MYLIMITGLVGSILTLVVGAAICCTPMGLVTAPFGGSLAALGTLGVMAWIGV